MRKAAWFVPPIISVLVKDPRVSYDTYNGLEVSGGVSVARFPESGLFKVYDARGFVVAEFPLELVHSWRRTL